MTFQYKQIDRSTLITSVYPPTTNHNDATSLNRFFIKDFMKIKKQNKNKKKKIKENKIQLKFTQKKKKKKKGVK